MGSAVQSGLLPTVSENTATEFPERERESFYSCFYTVLTSDMF